MSPQKILLVDDEAAILRSTRLLLEDLGYVVATCNAAQEIVSTLRRERPDAMLQDLRMPGLDIDKLVLALRADKELRRVPLILFSASMDIDDVQHRIGASAFLEKPFEPSQLIDAIDHAIERSRGEVTPTPESA